MSQIAIPPVSSKSFSASGSQDGSSVRLKLSGSADMEVHAQLAQFLERLHEQVCEKRVGRVAADIRELYFMNSSCLKLLVVWMGRVAKLTDSSRYRVLFLTDSNLQWQRRTLEAMQAFAPAVVEIEEV
jgi:hypothetical protein